jgi:hypothetical protein
VIDRCDNLTPFLNRMVIPCPIIIFPIFMLSGLSGLSETRIWRGFFCLTPTPMGVMWCQAIGLMKTRNWIEK